MKLRTFLRRWIKPFLFTTETFHNIREFLHYRHDWTEYERLANKKLNFTDSYPCLTDRTTITPPDAHYFYQAVWAANGIAKCNPRFHVDIGSQLLFGGILAGYLPVIFVDIRPLEAPISNFTCISGDVLQLPFKPQSVSSISCLHVIEHIGLGRYGDKLDPAGTIKAARELTRIVAPNGHLFLSLPIGRPQICFNAHRVHSPQQILEYFSGLELIQFCLEDDAGQFFEDCSPSAVNNLEFGCGMFHFQRRS